MSMSGSDEKITCGACGKIIQIQQTEKHVTECMGKKNENRN